MDEDFDIPAAEEVNEDFDFAGEKSSLKVGEEKEIGNQGLKKKLLKEGEGWDTPDNGDEVEVNYSWTLLDGMKVDSSRDRDTTFKFTFGQGQVIKGWDLGIKTMKKRENALFTVPPYLAYGASGSPPIIPPHATLQFDVELISWTSVKDICKDGGIFKKIIVRGEKWENPKDPDEVLVKFEARIDGCAVVAKSDGIEFTVRDGYFCPALSKAVKTMKKGEKVLLTVKPQYGFGEKGKPASGGEGAVPPNATLQITLELLSWKVVSEVTNDRKVIKKNLKEGERYQRPSDGCVGKEAKRIHKYQLQIYAQKKNLKFPVYSCEREGPSHDSRFKCDVTIDGKTYMSDDSFSTIKDSEDDAAKIALASLSQFGAQEFLLDDSIFYKNRLQELSQRRKSNFPIYKTEFISTVEFEGEIFSGQTSKTRKQAEMSAAKVAYHVMRNRSDWGQAGDGGSNFNCGGIQDALVSSSTKPLCHLSSAREGTSSKRICREGGVALPVSDDK